TGDQRNHSPGSPERIPNCRVPRRAWVGRPDRASEEVARPNCEVPPIFPPTALTMEAAGLANVPGVSTDSGSKYREILAWLYQTQRFGIKLGLDSIRRMLHELEVPGKEQRILHVAGTNGKGS